MARGKHAAAAARRRADESTLADLATYQRRVAELTAALKDQREARTTEAEAFRREVRSLRALVESGASPEVAALNRTLARVREERDAARRDAKDTRALWGKVYKRVIELLVSTDLVANRDEALELLIGENIWQSDVRMTGKGRHNSRLPNPLDDSDPQKVAFNRAKGVRPLAEIAAGIGVDQIDPLWDYDDGGGPKPA